MTYFESEWVRKNTFWYKGAAAHILKTVPSSNNAIEAANRLIKDEHTLRERFDLGQFRAVLLLETWSLAYVDGEKEFHDTPEIKLEQWTAAYAWAKHNIPMKVIEQTDKIVYKSPSQQYENSNFDEQNDDWNSIEEFLRVS